MEKWRNYVRARGGGESQGQVARTGVEHWWWSQVGRRDGGARWTGQLGRQKRTGRETSFKVRLAKSIGTYRAGDSGTREHGRRVPPPLVVMVRVLPMAAARRLPYDQHCHNLLVSH